MDKPNALKIEDFIGNDREFPILREWDFFNHSGVAPLPRRGADALRDFAAHIESQAYMNQTWHKSLGVLRQSAATMLNCHREEIAFIKNTSEGLSTVARGLAWEPGDRIVTTAVEYPANIYPWMEICQTHGTELVLVPEEDGPDGTRLVPAQRILEAASAPRTRMVTLSHVEFASGQRHDLARIGRFCSERNILLCVDAIQTMGVIPIDVREMHIDFLSADGHKWLLGPEGAGIFYCRRELLEQLRPLTVGWMNVVDAQNFDKFDYKLRPDAGRFEAGSLAVPGLLALKISLELLLELGVENVSRRIQFLTDHLIAGLRQKGYRIASPRTDEQWSGIVSFASDKFDLRDSCAMLQKQHRTELVMRKGRMRCAPHFYNTTEQLDRLLQRLPSH